MTMVTPRQIKWVIGAAMVAVCLTIVWSILAITHAVKTGVDNALSPPGVPEPGMSESAETKLTVEGVRLTIKQRGNAWLPGGRFKLHLDDITDDQVLISITDSNDRVVMGPSSVKAGQTIALENVEPTMVLDVRRLVNLLTGDDFGEFLVRPETSSSNGG